AQSEPRVYSDARTIPIPGTSYYKQGFENLVSIPFIPNRNGAGSDDCTGATDVFAGETYVGNTGDYTDTGGNAAPDVWYAYSGAAGAVTLSLCDGATDYDSYLRVYDACGGTQIAANDDSCSLQSELEFAADGTSTYYIMVEGYGSGSGNYSLSVSVLSPGGGDTCDGAYPVVSGETYVGDTSTMTDTGSNPSPDAWYSYNGAAGDVTLSLCEGTDYDSYLRVFDACGGTEIASNDDSCSLQSEIVFAADAGATYYIMVEGYSSSSGNFSLAVSVEEEEEEEWGPCENGTTSNAFENGYSGPICNDVVVAADDNFLLEEIMPSYFHDIGAVFESIDVRIFSADFGTLIYEQAGAPVISQEYQGENYGFDISMLSILIDPVDMPGTSGAETSYWVELSNAVTSGASTFWELESTEVIGQPYYVGEAGAGGIVDDVTDGVFVWAGQCESGGGGGGGENDCGIGNVEPDGEGGNFGVDYLLGVSYTLEEEGTINSINMIGNGGGSLVQMAVYNDLGGVPDDLIVFSEIAEVGNGMTVYPVTPTVIPPGDYWIMAVYEFQGDHSNVLQETGNPVYYTALPFGDPIPTNASDFLSYADRDFLYSLDITCSGGSGGAPANDLCVDAIAVQCDGVYAGETTTATDTGGNPAPDVWYKYSGAAGDITLSLCDGGTDYDSYLRVYDACDGTEIADNDDSCDLQSELTFAADGTSTYYIMVEGYGDNSGNFSLEVFCELITPANDLCEDAIAVECDGVYAGETATATDTGGNPAPDVWYS
ncbi:MAG: hypothetical protein ACKVKI_04900, partial [Flavobacteriales bacterium]